MKRAAQKPFVPTFMMVREAGPDTLNNSRDVANAMSVESRIDRECFWALHLNTKNSIIEKELVSMGSVEGAIVTPRESFRRAVANGTARIIFVHNHPSGDTTPSFADIDTAKNLRDSGELLAIHVLDFIVLGKDGRYESLADKSFFEEWQGGKT